MSAFRGKADIPIRSLMSANDPKRTLMHAVRGCGIMVLRPQRLSWAMLNQIEKR